MAHYTDVLLPAPRLSAAALAALGLAAAPTRAGEDGAVPVRFVDVAREAGIAFPHVWGAERAQQYIIEVKGSGLAFYDYDHDGWLDVYLTNGVRLGETYAPGAAPTSRLLRNERDGTFRDVTASAGIGRTGWATGVAVGDYDGDGWDDLFCTYWGHDVLWRNRGDGTFEDVTRAAGLHHDEVRWGTGATFLDHDLDGDLDLYVGNFIDLDLDSVKRPGEPGGCFWMGIPVVCGPRGLPPQSDAFYRNEGDGTFTDVSDEAGVLAPGPHYSITPVSYDFDADGWPDVYVAVDSMPSLLFRNDRDGTFSEVALASGCAYNFYARPQAGMGVAVGDYDGDGVLDIFKTHFQHDTPVLFRGHPDGTYSDETEVAGLAALTRHVCWGVDFTDVDNDGWDDLFYVTGHVYQDPEEEGPGDWYSPRVVLRNLGDGTFRDVSQDMGPGVAQERSSRGSAYGDYDNDGDVDVLVLNVNDPPSLLRNDGGDANRWLSLKLVGTRANTTGIGARVRVVTGDRSQIDEVHSGGSVMSQSDLRLHFGLGRAEVVDRIEVRWPTTGKTESFTDVAADQFLTIREGEGIVERRPPAGDEP